MAWEHRIFNIPGALANADLSAKQFFCVKQTAVNNKVGLCDTDGEVFIGVLQTKPAADAREASVMALGITKVEAGETLTAGDSWGTDNAGKAKVIEKTVTGADVGDYVAGTVLEGAASGELATVTIGFGTFMVEAQ